MYYYIRVGIYLLLSIEKILSVETEEEEKLRTTTSLSTTSGEMVVKGTDWRLQVGYSLPVDLFTGLVLSQ